jgi:hypothetical protein
LRLISNIFLLSRPEAGLPSGAGGQGFSPSVPVNPGGRMPYRAGG